MLQLTFANLNKPPIWLVKPSYRIGSASDSDVRLERPGVLALHAELVVEHELVFLEPAAGAKVALNGSPAAGRTPLGHDSVIEIADMRLRIIDPKRSQVAPTAGHGRWFLHSKNLALGSNRYEISQAVVIGRSKTCDICLSVAHLSREHARLKPAQGGIEVEDLKSSNGTFINGKRITKAIAKVGDELSFDSLKFEVARPDEPLPDLESTSLRPAITQEQLDLLKAEAGDKSQRPAKRVLPPPVVSPRVRQSDEVQASSLPLLLGLAVVLVATVALLTYLIT